jgi:hypothetical protein
MVIVFTLVISLSVIGTGLTVTIVKIKDPNADVSVAVSSLTSVIASILAALLGLVAGKSEALNSTQKRPDEEGAHNVYERPDEHPHGDPNP